ncbi:restriction endonuclease subunit S [Enterovibrio norvegicus]|uniref:restriction endonuclease subunit S n=1 Tax=Enterovibrio norvegicus TaxID=188144 RepID=UPI00352E9BDB
MILESVAGWQYPALGDICDVRDGTHDSPKYVDDGFPLITSKNLTEDGLCFEKVSYITKEDHDAIEKRSAVSDGDILYGMIGTVGNPVIVKKNRAFSVKNVAIFKFLEESLIFNKYLFYVLSSDFVSRQISKESKGGTQKFVSLKVLRGLKIPLPPLKTQKKIASVLEKADQLRKDCQQMEQELNSLAQSVFIDMFGDPVTNPKGWDKKELFSLCSKVTDGTHQSPEWAEVGVPFLFISNVRNGKVDFDTGKYITRRCYEELTRTCPIEVDDILYTTVGSYGHVALVKDCFPDFCFQRHIAHIKPDPNKIIPEFLYYQLQTSGVKHLADLAVKGIAQKTLNLKDLKKFEMIVPPEDKQLELINYMNHQFQALNGLEKIKSEYEMLFSSLMQKAFKGELNL